MFNDRNRSDYGLHIHRVKTIHTAAAAGGVFIFAATAIIFLISWQSRLGNEQKDLLELWDAGDYGAALNLSGEGLQNKPLDFFLLTLHGFSAYQVGIAQINSQDTLAYIDDCIWSLRKALLLKNSGDRGRVYYVLGKAYYYKGKGFADLAVKYLEMARNLSYRARDIPEYLGLAYAAVQDYRSSVAAFTLALNPGEEAEGQSPDHPSDVLLLSIARSYIALDESDAAKAYLRRCIETSRDSNARVAARLFMGELLGKDGDTEAAEAQYRTILEEAGENAEARYQLGELYALKGDTTRARFEWRRAVQADPAHAKARMRINM